MINNYIVLAIILVLNTALNGTVLWTDAFRIGDSWFIGRLLALIIVVTVFFLLRNLLYLRKIPTTSLIACCWFMYIVFIGYATSSEFATQYGPLLFLREALFPSMTGPLVYLFFFVVARRNPRAINIVGLYFAVLTGINCVAFYALFQAGTYGEKPTAISAVYFPLLTLPWVLSTRRHVWRWLIGAAIVVIVFFSLKRTALLMTAAAAIVFTWASGAITWRFRGLKMIGLCLMLAAGIWGFLRANEVQDERLIARVTNAFQDRGSGRLDIYLDVQDAFFDSSWWNVLIGHGHGAVGRHLGVIAHSDLLEVPFDYGICGLALYLCFHGALIARARRMIRSRSPHAPAFAVSYVLFLFMSCTSNLVIFPHLFVILMSFWGFMEGISSANLPAVAWRQGEYPAVAEWDSGMRGQSGTALR